MPIYSKHVGPKLKKKLEELQAVAAERASLIEEVDISRILTARALLIYEAVVENDPEGMDASELAHTRARATLALKDCLKLNADLVARMVDLESKTGNAIPATNVAWFTHQIMRIIESNLADHVAVAAICKEIEDLKIAPEIEGTKVVLSIEE